MGALRLQNAASSHFEFSHCMTAHKGMQEITRDRMYCRPVERALCVGCFVFCRPDSSKRMEVFALLCSTSEGTGRRDDGEMHTGYMCIFM